MPITRTESEPFETVGDKLKGRVAMVTGGTRGIGAAICHSLAAQGAAVAAGYGRDRERAEAFQAELSNDEIPVSIHQGNVGSAEDCRRTVQEVIDHHGRLDILVNNAGIQISRPSHELSSADFDRVLAVNLRGSFLCARQAIRHFLAEERGGSIVNVSSVHQLIPKPDYLGYSVSKGGMQNLTRTLALEYGGRGIRVNGVGPGATITPINRAWVDDPVKAEMVTSHIPLNRAGTADEMAGVCAFLASDDGAYITGQTIFVDGGLTLYPSFREPWSSE
jgi:glucose 1-dehydrogenase